MASGARRTLKRAVDLQTLRTITSDELAGMHADDYQVLRRQATRARATKTPRFACECCGFPVYAPRAPRTGVPLWRHHAGAPASCPWWTGDPAAVDDISARQFDGTKESALHVHLKNLIGRLLEADARTLPGSVSIDRYLSAEHGRRRPDVLAVHQGVATVFEVQLATTQIPIILGREDFYEQEAIRLLWVTWGFTPPSPGTRLQSSLEDVFYSHGKCLFSIDAETAAKSAEEHCLYVRAFRNDDGWNSRIVALHELDWQPNGRGTLPPSGPTWSESFLLDWTSSTTEYGTPWQERTRLLEDLSGNMGPFSPDAAALEDADIADLLNCLLSILRGQPLGSRQKNLQEVVNTFLMVPRRQRLAQLLSFFCTRVGRSDLLEIPSIKGKLEAAMIGKQDGRKSIAGLVVLCLFPQHFSGTGR